MSTLKASGIDVGKGKYHEEIIYSLAMIYNVMNNELASYFNQFDLTLGKFNILMIVKHRGKEEGIPQVEISKQLILTPSNMTKLIDKLEKDGLVTREALEGDRRVNITKITKKGSALLDQVWDGYNNKLVELTQSLEKDKQKLLSELLVTWLNKINQ